MLPEIFEGMVREIAASFDYTMPPQERQNRIKKFHWLADRTFRLAEFLKSTDFSPADSLTINTLVTAIPWDLVPYDEHILGHLVSVGLKIPTPRSSHPLGGAGEGRPRFLHIVANPANDLPHAAQELRELRSFVDTVPHVEYDLLVDPTPAELIHKFSAGRSTPFLHFTGHVLPKRGLMLKGGVMSIDDIVRYFPSQRDQFVFLNGCDAVYESEALLDGGEPDLFQTASVANAFLDAGAEAVIAPRSRIWDDDAYRAALQMWKQIFDSGELGAIVRGFRSSMLEEKPSAISGYSYVLYGEPSSRLRLPSDTPTRVFITDSGGEEANAILRHELLLEASGDAGGPVAPRHIFAALTRRWSVGHIFFELEKQRYFLALERLRSELGAQSPPPPGPPGQVECTAAGRLVVDRALARRTDAALDDLSLLEGLALVNDAEVRCALEALERGPRSIEAVLHYAREWVERGSQSPAVVIEPGGFVNPRAFPGGFLSAEPGEDTLAPATRWDVFVALLRTSGRAARLWTEQGYEVPPASGWRAGQSLHFMKLPEPLQDAMVGLVMMMEEEGAERVTEGMLLASLSDWDGFQWRDLPPHAREWLSAQGIDEERWDELLRKLHRKGLAWL